MFHDYFSCLIRPFSRGGRVVRTPSLELTCMGMSSRAQKENIFGRHVLKTCNDLVVAVFFTVTRSVKVDSFVTLQGVPPMT